MRNFKAVGENIFRMVNKIVEDDDICKLLVYTDKTPLNHPPLSEEEKMDLINNRILVVPKAPELDDVKGSYIIVLYDSFTINPANTEFKDVNLLFIVVCPPEDWIVNGDSLRPYLIMSRIDELFNGKKLANIGTLKFVRAERFVLNSQLSGYAMSYSSFEFN